MDVVFFQIGTIDGKCDIAQLVEVTEVKYLTNCSTPTSNTLDIMVGNP